MKNQGRVVVLRILETAIASTNQVVKTIEAQPYGDISYDDGRALEQIKESVRRLDHARTYLAR